MSNKTHVKAHHGREHKKEQFSKPARRSSSWAMGLIVLVLVAVVAYFVVGRVREDPTAPTVSAKSIQVAPGIDEVRIPLSEVNTSQAKFFEATLPNNTTTRFFVVKTSDGLYRAALDACQVCFDAHKGYYQDGNVMVCKKCGRRFPISGIGYGTTGCHPMGLTATVDGDELKIKTSELTSGSQYF
jgi:uncharacterized membrane protein